MKQYSVLYLLMASVGIGSQPAAAHVTLETAEAKAGSGYKAVFKLPHGCEGSATVSVKIDIPEGVIAVKPMPKPGWKIDLVSGPYAQNYAFYHGEILKEGVKQVTWTGGPLPDAYYDEFVLSTFVAREPGADRTIYFPVHQTCELGTAEWIEVPKAGESAHSLKSPAPMVHVVAVADAGGESHSHAATRAGDLTIEDAFARATPDGAAVGAGYLKITNSGTASDTLTGASSDVADRVEVHEMTTSPEGVMRMRPVTGGLEIKPGATVELKPGGMHLMLLGLKRPLKQGERIRIRLTFAHAPAVEVEMPVAAVGAASGEHAH